VPRNLFTKEQILAIRQEAEVEYNNINHLKIVYSSLAAEYGVSAIAIHLILTKQVWGDLHILKKDCVDAD